MKLNVFLLAMVVIACTGAIAAGTEHADATVKIAPIGDSITRGGIDSNSPYPSYRYYLWNMLRNGGYDVDFVGSTTEPNFQQFMFDQDHDGYSAYTTQMLADDMDRILVSNTPDVVLLYIGTNDVLHPVAMKDRIGNVGRIVTSLREKNPNVRILLALISPTGDEFRNTNNGLYDYNEELVGYAQRTTTVASPIVIVDMNTAWSAEQFDQEDGVHPNTDGEIQLAQRWANALISTGIITPAVQIPVTPAPTPTPTVFVPTAPPIQTPTPAPTVVVTAAPIQAPVTLAPAASPTRSIFGAKRYALRPGMTGPGLTTSRSQVTTGSQRPGSSQDEVTSDPLVPPTRQFQRWYPAQRWAMGIR